MTICTSHHRNNGKFGQITLVAKVINQTSIMVEILIANRFLIITMAKNKEINLEKRAQIVILKETGKSYAEIARILKVCRSGVQKTCQMYRNTSSNTNQKGRGRKRKTTKRDDNRITTISKTDRFKTASDIRAEINQGLAAPISLTTVKRRLRGKGLIGRVAAKKPLLRPQNKRKRLQFAKDHDHWTIDQWKSVLWSDESKFQLFGSNRRQYIRRQTGERQKPNCVASKVKHGGGSVMVWGCFSYDGVGQLKKIDGILTKESYHSILQRHAIRYGIQLIGRGFVFQQDNDPKHTSGLCKNYLQKKEDDGVLQVMIWPAQSPDVNPIELLWDELDRRVRDSRPTSLPGLWECLREAWQQIQLHSLHKLVERLPKICKALIKAKGGHFSESHLK